MLGFEDVKGIADLVLRGVGAVRDRLDPAHLQAQRLIVAFEAYGIARQQIPRLLPRKLRFQPAAFSTPAKLKMVLTSDLLDWAADYLAVQRPWFDAMNTHPHRFDEFYKAPSRLRDWLLNRQQVAPDLHRRLLVWKSAGETAGPKATGLISIVYEEIGDGLDGIDLSRYWLLSEGWFWEHSPCVENMVAAVAIARKLGIQVVGHDVPEKLLRRLESGAVLAPQVFAGRRGLWYPEDLITPLPGRDTPWRRDLWEGVRRWLEEGGVLSRAGDRPNQVGH